MNVAHKILKVFAPHACIGCGGLGFVVCAECATSIIRVPSRCFNCHKVTKDCKTCLPCRRKTGLYQVFVVAHYEGLMKELIHALKYERAKAAAYDIVRHIDSSFLQVPLSAKVFVHIPTSHDRIRQRGYDQAQLLASTLARKHNIPCLSLLERTVTLHQIGSKGATRRKQLQGAFRIKKVPSNEIILVDDVTTTGATLSEAAKTFRKSGAKRVSAFVLAQA